MFFHKLTWDEEHPVYTYHTAMGTSISVRPGDVSPFDGKVVTAEDIKVLVSCHNAEVRNNIKNCKAPLSDKEKAEVREWEEAHPGESAPKKWNASLDHEFEDHDEMDSSSLMLEIYKHRHPDNPTADRLWDVIDQMTDTQKRALVMYHFEGMSLKEISEELGCCQSAVSRAIGRAEEFIEKNF